VAGAMRSAPTHRGAGNRAQRFLAATSGRVIRVDLTTTGASVRLADVGQMHPLVAAAPSGYELGAVSRRVERRLPPSLLALLTQCLGIDRTKWCQLLGPGSCHVKILPGFL
jgi:hypothetical protein